MNKDTFHLLILGRIGRWRYFVGSLLFLLLGYFLRQIIISALSSFGPNIITAIFILYILPFLPALLTFPITIRRLHDIGLSGRWVFLSISGVFSAIPEIPYSLGMTGLVIAILYNAFLIFKKGSADPNRYGNPPSKTVGFWKDILGTRND